MTKTLFATAITLALLTGSAYAQNNGVTTTLERTTTKTYTVSKQKVGMVGGRPYPVRTSTVDGGVKLEKFINNEKIAEQVLEPDPMLDNMSDTLDKMEIRQYYANEEGMKWYGNIKSDVKVRPVGRLND